jgi:ABC-2 type transport system permease protein
MVVDALRVYGRLLAASVRGQLSYRADFLLSSLGAFLITGIEAIGMWALFERFGRLRDWSLPEVALIYGTVSITFALADALGTGFELFAQQVRSGDFDRLLLRPRTTVLQVLGHQLAIRRVGRLSQGALVFTWAAVHLDLAWDAARVAVLLFAIAGGICLFLGLFVLQATAAFWTVEALEVFNAFTYGGTTAAQYPLSIYAPWLRKLFTFGVPLALVTYFPMVRVLGREDPLGTTPLFQALSPLAGALFLAASLVAFRVGVRRYTSTGS